MENELQPPSYQEPLPSHTYQEPLPSHTVVPVTHEDAEALRRNLEKNKLEVEKLTRKNAASNEYVMRAEKTERDVAKAGDDYKNAFAKLQTTKRDADQTNDSESREATARIGPHQGTVDTAVRAVDQNLTDLQKKVADLRQRKATSEAKFGEAQNSLAAAQAALQGSLAYPAELTAGLKDVADIQARIQRVKDPAHAAEFYFYTTEARRKLSQVSVKTPDELNAELSVSLAAVQRAIGDVVRAKADLIDVSVDLDVTQKQLADLEKNREAQILAKIRPYNQPPAKGPEVPAAEPAKPNAPAK
jgi:chromosome segregation ATPase